MSQIKTLVLDFSQEAENPYPLLYLEVPDATVTPGEEVEIRLWGTLEKLSGWTLCMQQTPLGAGELGQLAEPLYTQQVDLAAENDAALEYPFTALTKVTPLTPLTYVDPDEPFPPKLWRAEGKNITACCSRLGYSGLRVNCAYPLRGSLEVTISRVTAYRSWFWTVPADRCGDVWFFLYNDVTQTPYRTFALELPKLASVSVEYRNVSIYVADYSTDAPVAGAAVYLDDTLRGYTGADGVLNLSDIATGTHAFRAVASGYLDTDEDGLSNETIVVE